MSQKGSNSLLACCSLLFFIFPLFSSWVFSKKNTSKSIRSAKISLKVVYASTGGKSSDLSSKSIQNLPKLSDIYGFNRFQQLKDTQKKTMLGQKTVFALTKGFRFEVKLLKVDAELVRLRASLLRSSSGSFKRVATTHIRLKQNTPMAFVGPYYQKGRLLLILQVRELKK